MKEPSKEGLKNARERFHRARLILERAKGELDFDPPVDWIPELNRKNKNENKKNA